MDYKQIADAFLQNINVWRNLQNAYDMQSNVKYSKYNAHYDI